MHQPFEIHPETCCGPVALVVADLDRSLRYYTHHIGFQLLRRHGDTAVLGAGKRTLLQLTEQTGAAPVQRGHTGLYHFAIMTPSRYELSRTLHHLIATGTPIDGASDHAVSEALYLTDPDGHGIEIYRDRARAEWPVIDGQLRMTVDPLDSVGLLAEAGSELNWEGLDAATTIGHVHLHVADLHTAENFYIGLLGLSPMARYGRQASFVAAGGYHHHLGLNTWAGLGAPPPDHSAARLDWYTLALPDQAALTAVIERLQMAEWPVERWEDTWKVLDPSSNCIRLT